LSVLGWPEKEYNEYANRIWNEYSFYKRIDYCKGRISVLNNLISKDSLYFTQEFRDEFESQARLNVKNEIERLQKEYD
jgi:predicted metal-dependent HD superfamily phosphohydrolase